MLPSQPPGPPPTRLALSSPAAYPHTQLAVTAAASLLRLTTDHLGDVTLPRLAAANDSIGLPSAVSGAVDAAPLRARYKPRGWPPAPYRRPPALVPFDFAAGPHTRAAAHLCRPVPPSTTAVAAPRLTPLWRSGRCSCGSCSTTARAFLPRGAPSPNHPLKTRQAQLRDAGAELGALAALASELSRALGAAAAAVGGSTDDLVYGVASPPSASRAAPPAAVAAGAGRGPALPAKRKPPAAAASPFAPAAAVADAAGEASPPASGDGAAPRRSISRTPTPAALRCGGLGGRLPVGPPAVPMHGSCSHAPLAAIAC